MRTYVTALARRAEADDRNICGESRREELANAATHGLGVAFGFVALVLAVSRAAEGGSTFAIVIAGLYGSSLVACFLASTLYHSCENPVPKRRLLAADHCAIFLAIAATYTPITLLAMEGWTRWMLLGLAWGLALSGVWLRLFRIRYMHPLFVLMFFAMGWMGFAFAPSMEAAIGDGVIVLLIGCLCLTGGVAFYSWKNIRYHHALWHVASLAGAVVHFLVIYEYVLPIAGR